MAFFNGAPAEHPIGPAAPPAHLGLVPNEGFPHPGPYLPVLHFNPVNHPGAPVLHPVGVPVPHPIPAPVPVPVTAGIGHPAVRQAGDLGAYLQHGGNPVNSWLENVLHLTPQNHPGAPVHTPVPVTVGNHNNGGKGAGGDLLRSFMLHEWVPGSPLLPEGSRYCRRWKSKSKP